MDKAMQKLEEEGAAAYTAGETILDNPLYRFENLPLTSDKEFGEWEAMVAAWESGWLMEREVQHPSFHGYPSSTARKLMGIPDGRPSRDATFEELIDDARERPSSRHSLDSGIANPALLLCRKLTSE